MKKFSVWKIKNRAVRTIVAWPLVLLTLIVLLLVLVYEILAGIVRSIRDTFLEFHDLFKDNPDVVNDALKALIGKDH